MTLSVIMQRLGRRADAHPTRRSTAVVILGLILLLIGIFAHISILTTIGIILLVVGIILNLVPIGGTRRRVF